MHIVECIHANKQSVKKLFRYDYFMSVSLIGYSSQLLTLSGFGVLEISCKSMNNEVGILCVDNDDIIQTVDNSSFFIMFLALSCQQRSMSILSISINLMIIPVDDILKNLRSKKIVISLCYD